MPAKALYTSRPTQAVPDHEAFHFAGQVVLDTPAPIARCEARAAKNLDAWLASLYRYYVEGGHACIVASHVVNICVQLFTLILLGVIAIPMDWHALPFGTYMDWHKLRVPSLGGSFMLLYICCGMAYCAWHAAVAMVEIREAGDLQFFYQHVLEVPDDHLSAMEWAGILEALKRAHHEGRAKVVRVMDGLDWSGASEGRAGAQTWRARSNSAGLGGSWAGSLHAESLREPSVAMGGPSLGTAGHAGGVVRALTSAVHKVAATGWLPGARNHAKTVLGSAAGPSAASQSAPDIQAFGADRALLPEHYVVMRIMRQDNYLIAMRNQGLLDLTVAGVVPLPTPCRQVAAWCCADSQRAPRRRARTHDVLAMDAYQTLDTPNAREPIADPSLSASMNAMLGGGIEAMPAPAGQEQEPQPPSSGWRCTPHPRGLHIAYDVPWTALLDMNLRWALLTPMMSGRFELRQDWLTAEHGLITRLRSLAILNMVLLPLILPLVLIYQVILHLEDVHARKDYMGPRKWSTAAQQWFRDYNELPHVLHRRLAAAIPHATRYLGMFRSQLATIIARGVAYICGALVTLLVVIAAANDEALLHVTLGGFNLLWYTGLFTAVLAGARSMAPPQESAGANPAQPLSEAAPLVRHLPASWLQRAAHPDTRASVESLYPYRIQSLLDELIASFVLPYVLGVVLPGRAHIIAGFLQSSTVRVRGLGDVCGHALFDMEQFGEEEQAHGATPTDACAQPGIARARAGKVEASLLSFHANYPSWSRNVLAADLAALRAASQPHEADDARGPGPAAAVVPARHARLARGGGGCGLAASLLCAPMADIASGDDLSSDADSVCSGSVSRSPRLRRSSAGQRRARAEPRRASFAANVVDPTPTHASAWEMRDAAESFRAEVALAQSFLQHRQARALSGR